jgi:hypothetical protein
MFLAHRMGLESLGDLRHLGNAEKDLPKVKAVRLTELAAKEPTGERNLPKAKARRAGRAGASESLDAEGR